MRGKSAKLGSVLVKIQSKLKKRKEAQCFKLSPQSSTCVVKVKMDDFASKEEELKCVKMLQLPVNMNNATTGHKLQGMSKDKLIVVSWSFIANWIYVVLSCVRTLKGLFLLKPVPF